MDINQQRSFAVVLWTDSSKTLPPPVPLKVRIYPFRNSKFDPADCSCFKFVHFKQFSGNIDTIVRRWAILASTAHALPSVSLFRADILSPAPTARSWFNLVKNCRGTRLRNDLNRLLLRCPCQNRGVCTGDGQVHCQCPNDYYEGAHCETNLTTITSCTSRLWNRLVQQQTIEGLTLVVLSNVLQLIYFLTCFKFCFSKLTSIILFYFLFDLIFWFSIF